MVELSALTNLGIDDLLDNILVLAEVEQYKACLLYTSDAADERSSVDLGGRRIIKKKTKENQTGSWVSYT